MQKSTFGVCNCAEFYEILHTSMNTRYKCVVYHESWLWLYNCIYNMIYIVNFGYFNIAKVRLYLFSGKSLLHGSCIKMPPASLIFDSFLELNWILKFMNCFEIAPSTMGSSTSYGMTSYNLTHIKNIFKAKVYKGGPISKTFFRFLGYYNIGVL